MKVWGLGFRVYISLKVWGLGFRVYISLKVWGLGFRVYISLKVWGVKFMVQLAAFKALGDLQKRCGFRAGTNNNTAGASCSLLGFNVQADTAKSAGG